MSDLSEWALGPDGNDRHAKHLTTNGSDEHEGYGASQNLSDAENELANFVEVNSGNGPGA